MRGWALWPPPRATRMSHSSMPAASCSVSSASATPAPPADFRGVSLAWNAESEARVDAIMAHALRAGAKIQKSPQKVFWGGYSGYFADPDGHLWEVAYNPFFPLDASGHMQLP